MNDIVTEELVTGEWRAYFEGSYEPEHSGDFGPEGEGVSIVFGHGKTEQEAIDDLLAAF